MLQLNDEVMLDPVTGSMSSLLLHDAAEMLGREAEEVGVELHVAVLVAVLDNGVVETVTQPLGVGGGGAYGGVVIVVDDLRKSVDAAHQRVLATLEVETSDVAQGVDKGQNVIVLAVSQMEMGHLLVGKSLVAEVEAAHFGIEVGRYHNQRDVVVRRGLAGDARMLRIEYGEIVGCEPLGH